MALAGRVGKVSGSEREVIGERHGVEGRRRRRDADARLAREQVDVEPRSDRSRTFERREADAVERAHLHATRHRHLYNTYTPYNRPSYRTDEYEELQLNGDRSKTIRNRHIVHHDLHWLDVPRRVIFKLCMTVYKCLHGSAPKYLAELCVPVADVAGRRQLRSASRGLLNFPRYNMPTCDRRAFRFAGPHVWNLLPEHIRQSI